ncbi:MAG: twin-arginine translocase TatA/TatE family subunit [Myxococcota bacterium]
MGRLGMGELVVILIIILIIFGAGKLPQIGDAIGRGIRNFKKASAGEDEKKPDQNAQNTPPTAPPAPKA